MKRNPVQSANVVSIGHEGTTLEVEFKGGKAYRYYGVPHEVFATVIAAPSIGKALHSAVIGKYQHEPIGANDGNR